MTNSTFWKWTYKVVRSILFTAIGLIGLLYVGLYVLLSIPSVQNEIKKIAERELSNLFGSELTIDNVNIYPFNEVVVEGVTLKEPDGKAVCAKIERLGAGIGLWRFITKKEIVVTYVELLGLEASIRQDTKDGPLNIQFLIDAFKPKDKKKTPTLFDLEIRNIVIRKSKASFSRTWLPSVGKFPNLRNISITKLNADMTIPRLSNDLMVFDLRQLEFEAKDIVKVDKLSVLATLDHGNLTLHDFELELPQTKLAVNDLSLPLNYEGGPGKWIATNKLQIGIKADEFLPSELAFLWAPLKNLTVPMKFDLNLTGNLSAVDIDHIHLSTSGVGFNSDGYFSLDISGSANLHQTSGKSSPDLIELSELKLRTTPAFNKLLVAMLRSDAAAVDDRAAEIISVIGNLDLTTKGRYSRHSQSQAFEAEASLNLVSGVGDLIFDGNWLHTGSKDNLKVILKSPGVDFGKLLANDILGPTIIDLSANLDFDSSLIKNLKSSAPDKILSMIHLAEMELNVPETKLKGYSIEGTRLTINKHSDEVEAYIACNDENFNFSINAEGRLRGVDSQLTLVGEIERLYPGALSSIGAPDDFIASGNIDMSIRGDHPDNLQGEIGLTNILFNDLRHQRVLTLDNLEILASIVDDSSGEGKIRSYSIISDWIEGGITGKFIPTRIPKTIHGMLSETFPNLISAPSGWEGMRYDDDFEFDFTIFRDGSWTQFVELPVKLLYEAEISGSYDGPEQKLSVEVSAPYIQQGKDKLIQKTGLHATLRESQGNLGFRTILPTKKGDLEITADIASIEGDFVIGLDFNPAKTTSFYGELDMEASITDSMLPMKGKEVSLRILPSNLYLNKEEWNVGESNIHYFNSEEGPKVSVEGFSVAHGRQFVNIDGVASALEEDEILAVLNEVDLDYIFDTLNINYVKFGGLATGEAFGRSLFSKNIEAATSGLHVKDLSYNNAVLGDAELQGDFDISRKRVGIKADISEDGRRVALVDGGVWIGRDSLAFAIDADKVRIGFLAPFMQAFASKVEGRASGKAQLYGTFSDVDMTGRLFADTISVGIAYTNVTYGGRDSVRIDPGRINIPAFRLYDEHGHSATLTGELTHRYFHDPEFDFRVVDAVNLLLYDTNPKMNPVWYGRISGSGTGQILGRGNYVGISADMTTVDNSNFTFVVSDTEEAAEYKFLTFTDKKKAVAETEEVVELTETDAIVEAFKKKVQAQQQSQESVFGMDIRATITPSTRLTLVMDPKAGDKITARGAGAMNLDYRSDTDELKMYGKYILEEGVYNFSLQDLILKDFIIKQGSSISFNGDPMAGVLDIRAAYRVNTNLADLDQSFALDRDLNRTQVPVDAMLLVSGQMDKPDITFDIELPTLNDEVEQKVRSVISSEDMMNLQMIYLLALNRFYTPEYMGGSSGGEWASVASTTLSSQIANIMGKLTDKFSVAPSIRSDKGDFSDLEVDVALSSRLFNNRLLINGNLGYRDPSTSSTTFIGDFDVEYLLNRVGNWRLKAYNHFNDQNYYLKSALTTQGVGIMWRRDFDHIFGIKRQNKNKEVIDSDSIPEPGIP